MCTKAIDKGVSENESLRPREIVNRPPEAIMIDALTELTIQLTARKSSSVFLFLGTFERIEQHEK